MTDAKSSNTAPLRHRLTRMLRHLRRHLYGTRQFIPGFRERHRLEKMVGPLGFWDPLQKYHLEVLTKHGLHPKQKLLDFGCGPLLGGIAFIKYLEPRNYVGFDIDPSRIEAAEKQIQKHHLQTKHPRLFVSEDFGESELGTEQFNFMWASQMLYYFDDQTLTKLLTVVRQHLTPGGKFLGDIFELDHYEFKFPELGKYVRHTPESLEKIGARLGLRSKMLGTIGDFGYPSRLSLRKNLLFEFTHGK